MSGTIPLSMTQQFDEYGEPLSGGQLYIFQAGTVATPQNPYHDAALTLVMPNPITLDQAGRIPQFFLADGYIKIILNDVNGITQLAADGILVIGPSAGGGGGGGGSVDPTTIMQTGDMKFRYDTAILSGFVRANGNTIGSSASGATELADLSAQNLFNYLWNCPDTTLAVIPVRGVSSAADWAANRQIATPDFRGYAISGRDGMGGPLAGRITSSYFGAANADLLGANGGAENFTLAAAHIPAAGLSVSGTTGTENQAHTHPYTAPGQNQGVGSQAISLNAPQSPFASNTGAESNPHNHAFSANLAGGGGQPHRTIGPRKCVTFYLKL